MPEPILNTPAAEPAPTYVSAFDDLPKAALERSWLRPVGLLGATAARAAIHEGIAAPLAGGPSAFTMIEVLARRPSDDVIAALGSLRDLAAWAQRQEARVRDRISTQLDRLTGRRAAWAGLALDRPLIMGIVNVTPDSFSDGGDFASPDLAIAQGRALLAAGADILDVGGESTRPRATPVAPDDESRRVLPVVRALAAGGAVVSIDTRHAAVMAAAVAAGARIINDVSALSGDPDSAAIAARTQAPVVLMHMQGDPQTMQDDPTYALASLDIVDYLAGRIEALGARGIPRERIVVDPGIGFGKRSHHNLEIMSRLALFQALGCGVLLGVSRKSLIGQIGGGIPPKARLPGSLAGTLYALGQGVQILRVHDVAETRQAIATWTAMVTAG
jgi:dihydropteroate synthase